ncbi:efflux RND transporter periplasmic adaptor subunit [Sphingomonas sanguinis]|jgi:membrane fusion protein (multidrug efflux system)|uniref:efflux RND transporter periplasmic adaptor subunit n=1 Tax=Sphingomonas sp. LC-1 TaxID=3110957 RepID=UPI0021BA97B4|nr:efflux RND transporter periplasmic adaptor subunit [Sphingomonas sp. LC-1]MCT8003343.1 efflux RND transporter periplasmic adaptor subunit [Sphingomonas sp. LC-1]
MSSNRLMGRVLASGALLALAACGAGGKQEQQQAAQGPAPVGYVVASEQPVTLTTELPGRTTAFETSDVRPQVNGLITQRLFVEGDMVRQGQPLYRIDPAPYQAQAASARAALTRARASIASSAALARRYGELVKINAIARQEFENAQTSAAQARADVAAQQAALRTAEIDLARTTIRAPITGRIGRSVFTTGALVSASQTDALATIQRLDPIYVDIQEPSAELLKLRRQIMSGQLTRDGNARVKLTLEDGSEYGPQGTLRFADVTVDPTTGSQVIRALFPNPNGLLLPGMFVRASLVEGTQSKAFLVPQRAVSRDEKGQATVMVIGAGNKVEVRTLQTGRSIGDNWLVNSGLKAGDKIIVEGGMLLRPGMPVQGKPWNPNAKPAGAPPQAGQAQEQAK